MNITIAGVALVILLILLARGGTGRVGILVAAMCGSVVAFFGSAALIAWDIGTSIAEVANDVGGTGVG